MNLSETADTHVLANVDVTGNGSGADVEPENGSVDFVLIVTSRIVMPGKTYQSCDCGGSSFAWLVFTVSAKPVDNVIRLVLGNCGMQLSLWLLTLSPDCFTGFRTLVRRPER